MSKYWQKRFEMLEDARNKTAKGTVQAVTPAFDQAQAQIEKEINAWYGRFAKNNEISLQEAKKLLTTRELKEFRWDVEEYIKWGRQNAIDQQWMKQLENASARFHISRLEALKIRTQNAAERAFGNELDQLDSMAARIYTDDYYHTAYEIQKGLGIGFEVGQIDQRKLDAIVSKPWTTDKMTFSDRIWKAKTQLVDSLHKELTQMCVLGKAPDQVINNIANRMNVSKGQAGRLVMTEAAYFGSVAQKDCFEDLDVEFYEIVATLDNRTSETCQQMDGKVFKMSDFQAGVTAPPFHVWCRSCTAPWFEDNDADGERAARDPDSGKTYYVPADMKYSDWMDYFVNKTKDPIDWLTPVVDIEALRKQLYEKQKEANFISAEYNIRAQEQTEFLSWFNDPDYKKLHDMSDHERQVWDKVLKDKERELALKYDEINDAYHKYLYERPDRKSPERAAWNEWHNGIVEKYGVRNGAELFNRLDEVQNDIRTVRREMNLANSFSRKKAQFAGKTPEFYVDELSKLKKKYEFLEDEIKSLKQQIEDAVKAQAEAAYELKTLREIKNDIIKKHESILKTDVQKQEFSDIIDSMDKERANLYDKMSANFGKSNYYEKGTGWYMPSEKRIHMDLNDHPWDSRVGRDLHGAWKTKFHEEMHQLDHILGTRKSPLAMLEESAGRYASKMTATTTVTGKKMIEAIDEDVLNFINKAVDWDSSMRSVPIKPIKSLARISTDAKEATIRYLKERCPTAKDRALIDTLTDAIGLTTKGNLHPHSRGFWGHDKAYSKDRGKNGATSEAWANIAGFMVRGDTEALDALKQVMPKTVSVFQDVFNEVLEYAKLHDLNYTL